MFGCRSHQSKANMIPREAVQNNAGGDASFWKAAMQRHFRIKIEDSVKTKRGGPTDGFRRAAFGLEHSTGQVVDFESFC